jgi:hypothetical protein
MDRHFKPSFCGDRKMPTTKLVALALATSRICMHNNVSFGGAPERQTCVLFLVDWSSWMAISGKKLEP